MRVCRMLPDPVVSFWLTYGQGSEGERFRGTGSLRGSEGEELVLLGSFRKYGTLIYYPK